MMRGRGKSDLKRSAAEPVEPRAGTKGNAGQQNTDPGTVSGNRVTRAGTYRAKARRHLPEVGAVCGKAARTDLCGLRLASALKSAVCDEGAAAKPSEQPRTESCVASGNGRCEA